MEISGLEDLLLAGIRELGTFKKVDSAGRDEAPKILAYPYASAFFLGDGEIESCPRPVDELRFGIMVSAKNVQSEEAAAADAYLLIDAVRTKFRGKTLGQDDLTPLVCRSRELISYEDGIITYLVTLATTQIQPIVSE